MGRSDLVVASNRGPLSFALDDSGRPVRTGSGGGLAAALGPLLEDRGATWVSCAMSDADRKAIAEGLMTTEGIELLAVQPDASTYRGAYDVVSNATLWFCHHHLFDLARRPRLDRRWGQAWDAYRELNAAFAAAVSEVSAPGATVLVQDYHLCLVPGMLAAERDDLRVVHFMHTPFADPSMLRVLPDAVARELLEGMAAATACGFHARRWEAAFAACCDDAQVAPPRTFVSPLSPDPERLARRASSPESRAAAEDIASLVGDRAMVVSVDRVEPSKNLLRGIWALDELLGTHPELHGNVVMFLHAYPSRQSLPEYLAYTSEIEHAAAHVNETWATPEWAPLIADIADDADRSFAALTRYDVLLVNPLRDGLNLVAKEGPLVNTTDGVLVLSREAGAFAELADGALEVNPFDITTTAEVLARAITMPAGERRRRAETLRALVTRRAPGDWLEEQLAQARA